MITEAGLVAHAVACLAYAWLAWRSLRRHADEGSGGRWLIAAAAATSLWAFLFVVAATRGGVFAAALPFAETLRSAAWGVFLARLLAPAAISRSAQGFGGVFLAAAAAQLLIDCFGLAASFGAIPASTFALAYVFTRIALSVAGLVLVHNLFVNTNLAYRWSVRLLCIGLGGVFAYDLNLYTIALLGGGLPADLFNIRGLADALCVPLIAVSAQRSNQLQIRLSRDIVFQTVSLVGIGGYFVTMSALGYGLRAVGGDWGRLLEIGFLSAAVLFAAVVLFSGKFRAWARVQINKNFFALRYDYRREWLRFIATLSDDSGGTLPERVIKSVCQIVDSPGGVLFTAPHGGPFTPAARWNPLVIEAVISAGDPLPAFLSAEGRIVNLDDLREGRGHGSLPLPDFAIDRRLWLIVPLLHLDQLSGFIVVERTLAPRVLNWEDYDLLRTAGRQAASYIAEAALQRALLEARKFDEFNRRFAFILHDIKNVVSQLSLVARNAERHGANPAFQADMAATLQNSVARLQDLLGRLGAKSGERAERGGRFDLSECVREVGQRFQRAHALIAVEDATDGPLWVEADAARVQTALEHLAQNAVDASGAADPIRLTLQREGDHARIDVEDHGQGMTPDFIRDGLFDPFHSTKPGGFGVGAYEAREIITQARGRLSVLSKPGEGTTFTVLLPLAGANVEMAA